MLQRSLKYICRSRTFPRQVQCYSSTEVNTSKDDATISNSENDSEDSVQVSRYGSVTIIELNRTKKRNAINQQMAFKICEAITKFENDESSPVGVIHGVGGSFSSGYDIDDLQSDTLKLENLLNSEGTAVSANSFNIENFKFK